MELWIRSQDKTRLIKIKCLDAYENEIVDEFGDTLGRYETKKRALEILDEIQTHLLKMGEIEMLTNENGIINGIKDYGIVYEMPKD